MTLDLKDKGTVSKADSWTQLQMRTLRLTAVS